MNPPAATDSDPANYVAAVLILYVELPETPMPASVQDQWQARRYTIVEFRFAWLNPLSCWHHSYDALFEATIWHEGKINLLISIKILAKHI